MVFHYYLLVISLKQKPMLLMFLNYINICDILCDIMDYSLQGSSLHGDSPGKNTGVSCHVPHSHRIYLCLAFNIVLHM